MDSFLSLGNDVRSVKVRSRGVDVPAQWNANVFSPIIAFASTRTNYASSEHNIEAFYMFKRHRLIQKVFELSKQIIWK
jgi:hypothetical protein